MLVQQLRVLVRLLGRELVLGRLGRLVLVLLWRLLELLQRIRARALLVFLQPSFLVGILDADFGEGRGGFLEQPAVPLELILEQGHALIQSAKHAKDLANSTTVC